MFKWEKHRKIYLYCLALLFLYLVKQYKPLSNKDGRNIGKILAHRGLAQTFDESKADWDSKYGSHDWPAYASYLRTLFLQCRRRPLTQSGCREFDEIVQRQATSSFSWCNSEFKLALRVKSRTTRWELKRWISVLRLYGWWRKTYPFRGKGVGQMPTIDEVFEAFQTRSLWLRSKTGN